MTLSDIPTSAADDLSSLRTLVVELARAKFHKTERDPLSPDGCKALDQLTGGRGSGCTDAEVMGADDDIAHVRAQLQLAIRRADQLQRILIDVQARDAGWTVPPADSATLAAQVDAEIAATPGTPAHLLATQAEPTAWEPPEDMVQKCAARMLQATLDHKEANATWSAHTPAVTIEARAALRYAHAQFGGEAEKLRGELDWVKAAWGVEVARLYAELSALRASGQRAAVPTVEELVEVGRKAYASEPASIAVRPTLEAIARAILAAIPPAAAVPEVPDAEAVKIAARLPSPDIMNVWGDKPGKYSPAQGVCRALADAAAYVRRRAGVTC